MKSYHYSIDFEAEGRSDDHSYWPHDFGKKRFTPAEIWKIAREDGRARWATKITVTEMESESTEIPEPKS